MHRLHSSVECQAVQQTSAVSIDGVKRWYSQCTRTVLSVRYEYQVSLCEICGGKCGAEADISPSTSDLPFISILAVF